METNTKVSSYMLGLHNLNRCKYGVILYIYRTLKNVPEIFVSQIDFEKAFYYLVDFEQYKKYKDEPSYASDFFVKFLNSNCITIFRDYESLNELERKSKKYSNYIITPEEVEAFEEILSYIITAILISLQEGKKNPVVRLIIPNKNDFYADEEDGNTHFFKSLEAFLRYHKCNFANLTYGVNENEDVILSFYI